MDNAVEQIVEWQERANRKYTAMLQAIADGNVRIAGHNAAHLCAFQSAIERVASGESLGFANDPVYSEFYALNTYFAQ